MKMRRRGINHLRLFSRETSAESFSFDTVTFEPPQGFDGNSVSFTLVDSYSFLITGVSRSSTANLYMCWEVLSAHDCVQQQTNGRGTHKILKGFKLKKSQSGFEFTIFRTQSATASSFAKTATGTVNYGVNAEPKFQLPSGWSCKFASGQACHLEAPLSSGSP
jgi:hypothetical protein